MLRILWEEPEQDFEPLPSFQTTNLFSDWWYRAELIDWILIDAALSYKQMDPVSNAVDIGFGVA